MTKESPGNEVTHQMPLEGKNQEVFSHTRPRANYLSDVTASEPGSLTGCLTWPQKQPRWFKAVLERLTSK